MINPTDYKQTTILIDKPTINEANTKPETSVMSAQPQASSMTPNNSQQSRILDLLIEIPLFDELNSDELAVIKKYVALLEISQNRIVFEEGDNGNYACFVVDGQLEVIKKSENGRDIVIANLVRGRSIGEMAVIDNLKRSATVRALTDALLISLSRENFEMILDRYPKIGIKILKAISRLVSINLRQTSAKLADHMLPLS